MKKTKVSFMKFLLISMIVAVILVSISYSNIILKFANNVDLWRVADSLLTANINWLSQHQDNLLIACSIILIIFVAYILVNNKTQNFSGQDEVCVKNIESPDREFIKDKSDMLRPYSAENSPQPRILGPAISGILIIIVFFVGLIGWAAFAPLSNASIASGKVTVESNRKTIQHLEGGIVSRIMVRDGDKVKAGQILIILDDTKSRSHLARLQGQLDSDVLQLALLNEEIKTVRDLFERGLSSKPRLLALQRRSAEIEGDQKKLTAEIKDAKDILKRSKIVAPISGTIVGLRIHTLGGVIKAGEPLMDIVPDAERLLIHALVNPIDIDVVHSGLKAMIYLTPYNRRTLRPIEGRVITVSADLLSSDDQSYYLAEIELTERPTKAIRGAVLYPGMPVEVMILTGKNTILRALFQPIWQSAIRSFREN